MRDAGSLQGLELVDEITLRVGRRQELAGPIGARSQRSPRRRLGKALATPAGDVVHINLVSLVFDLGFNGEPPSARPPAARAALESAQQHGIGRRL